MGDGIDGLGTAVHLAAENKRLQAEVVRLRGENETLKRTVIEYTNEDMAMTDLARLRRIEEAAREVAAHGTGQGIPQLRAALEAEVERLREEVANLRTGVVWAERDEAKAEVERLRRERRVEDWER